MGRNPCCDKSKVKRGTWSPEEDNILKNYMYKHGGTGGNWIALPHKAGLKRCGKSCRLRWLNYLRPDIKHGAFTQEDEEIICNLYNKIGSRWAIIASHLPGRTDNDVKNYWNTKLKKKTNLMVINTSTQESVVSPSQVFGEADYFGAPASVDFLENKGDSLEADERISGQGSGNHSILKSIVDSSSNSSSTAAEGSSTCQLLYHDPSLKIDELFDFGEIPILGNDSSYYAFGEEAIEGDSNEDMFSIFHSLSSSSQGIV